MYLILVCGTLQSLKYFLSLSLYTHTHTPHTHKLVDICKYTLIYTRVCVCVERGREPFSIEIKIKQTALQLCDIVAVEHRKE